MLVCVFIVLYTIFAFIQKQKRNSFWNEMNTVTLRLLENDHPFIVWLHLMRTLYTCLCFAAINSAQQSATLPGVPSRPVPLQGTKQVCMHMIINTGRNTADQSFHRYWKRSLYFFRVALWTWQDHKIQQTIPLFISVLTTLGASAQSIF